MTGDSEGMPPSPPHHTCYNDSKSMLGLLWQHRQFVVEKIQLSSNMQCELPLRKEVMHPPEWPPRGAATTAGGISGYCHWWLQLPWLASATTTATTKHSVHIWASYLSGLLFITTEIWLDELLARPSNSQAGLIIDWAKYLACLHCTFY